MTQDISDSLEHYSMTDFQPYSVDVEDMFGTCRPSNEFSKIDYIDHGSTGDVYKARDNKNGDKIVALKYIRFKTNEFPQDLLREVNNLRRLNHRNIVTLIDIALSQSMNALFLILEYCPYNLTNYIKHYPPGDLPVPQIKCIMKQLFSGLDYMHRMYIIHRDLVPANLLISNEKLLKISDLGSSRKFSYRPKLMSPAIGTLWYRAPEIILEAESYGPAVDIWSAGCILGELFTRNAMFQGKSDINQMNMIIDLLGSPNASVWPGIRQCRALKTINLKDQPFGYLNNKFSKLPETAMDLLSKLITYDPEARLSAADCLAHDWFETAPGSAKEIDVKHIIPPGSQL